MNQMINPTSDSVCTAGPALAANGEIPQELANALLTRLDGITMLPDIAAEALRITEHADPSMVELADVIKRDVTLTTDMLRMANSSLYGCSTSIKSIQQATVRLGANQCRKLILCSCIASLMQKMPIEQQWARQLLWQHGFTTAFACSHLNQRLKLGFQGEEFVAGLIHDFGRFLFAVAIPDLFPSVDSLEFDEGDGILAHEQALTGTDHCQFGAWFIAENSFPAELVEVIRRHHRFPGDATPTPLLVQLVTAGDQMANHLQKTDSPTGYELRDNAALEAIARETNQEVFQILEPEFGELLKTISNEAKTMNLIG